MYSFCLRVLVLVILLCGILDATVLALLRIVAGGWLGDDVYAVR